MEDSLVNYETDVNGGGERTIPLITAMKGMLWIPIDMPVPVY